MLPVVAPQRIDAPYVKSQFVILIRDNIMRSKNQRIRRDRTVFCSSFLGAESVTHLYPSANTRRDRICA
jgi:hypothetical protein